MTPSFNELTYYGYNFKKGDGFKLHAEGAKKLNELKDLQDLNRVKPGDVLRRVYNPQERIAGERKGQEVWLNSEKSDLALQVPVDEDLFSEKV